MSLIRYMALSWGRLPFEGSTGAETNWLHVADLRVTSGKVWIGDPQFSWAEANEGEGCIVDVPEGDYIVEAKGISYCKPQWLRGWRYVSRVRVRLKSSKKPRQGESIEEAGTDSGLIGVADPIALKSAFDEVCGADVNQALAMLDRGVRGRIGKFEPHRGGAGKLVYLPSGFGDGEGPVYELLEGDEPVGLEHEIIPAVAAFEG